MLELVKYLVLELVDNKEAAVVKQEGDIISISVDKKDMGKVIGRQGKIAKAIRVIVKAAGMKCGQKFSVEILDSDESSSKADLDAANNASDAE